MADFDVDGWDKKVMLPKRTLDQASQFKAVAPVLLLTSLHQWQMLSDDDVAKISQKEVKSGLCCYCRTVEPSFECTSSGCSCRVCVWCNIDSEEEECGCHYVPTYVETQLRKAEAETRRFQCCLCRMGGLEGTIGCSFPGCRCRICVTCSQESGKDECSCHYYNWRKEFHDDGPPLETIPIAGEVVLGVTPPLVMTCASCRRPVGPQAHHCEECGVTRCWWCIHRGASCACGDHWNEDSMAEPKKDVEVTVLEPGDEAA